MKIIYKFMFVAISMLAFINNMYAIENNSNTQNEPLVEESVVYQKFVEDILAEIYQVLPNSKSNKEIYSYFDKLTQEKFNINYIALWSLGAYGKNISAETKDRYLKIATRYMVISYGNVFTKYYETYSYRITKTEKIEENQYAVKFYIEPKNNSKIQDNAILAEWKIEKDDTGKMYVADIIVNGISLVNAQRFEFERSLKNNNGSVDAFSNALEIEVKKSEDRLGI